MSRVFEAEHKKYFGEVSVEYGVKYKEDERVEEGHGYHHFYDTEVVDVWINAVKLIFQDTEIDITDRLTLREKKQIADYFYE